MKCNPWKCKGCGKLLGYIYPGGILAVKYKDLHAWVSGSYKTICRNCLMTNIYKSMSLEEFTDQEEGNQFG